MIKKILNKRDELDTDKLKVQFLSDHCVAYSREAEVLESKIKELEAQLKYNKDEEYENQINSNSWEETTFDKIIACINKFTGERNEARKLIHSDCWSWVMNSRCKYISLRIDMRDGAFCLLDRSGHRISLKQLEYQYKDGDEDGV